MPKSNKREKFQEKPQISFIKDDRRGEERGKRKWRRKWEGLEEKNGPSKKLNTSW